MDKDRNCGKFGRIIIFFWLLGRLREGKDIKEWNLRFYLKKVIIAPTETRLNSGFS